MVPRASVDPACYFGRGPYNQASALRGSLSPQGDQLAKEHWWVWASGHVLPRQGYFGRLNDAHFQNSSPLFANLVVTGWYFRATRQGLPPSLNTRP